MRWYRESFNVRTWVFGEVKPLQPQMMKVRLSIMFWKSQWWCLLCLGYLVMIFYVIVNFAHIFYRYPERSVICFLFSWTLPRFLSCFMYFMYTGFHGIVRNDWTVLSKRPRTSSRTKIHFSVFIHSYLCFIFMKLTETL